MYKCAVTVLHLGRQAANTCKSLQAVDKASIYNKAMVSLSLMESATHLL